MARVAIIFGLLLCGLTVAALVVIPAKRPAQFVPMMIGIPVLFCGVVSLNPHRRRHAMLAAAGLALLGAIVGGFRAAYVWMTLIDGDFNRIAMNVIGSMALACAIFVVIWGFSFVQDRRRRETVAK